MKKKGQLVWDTMIPWIIAIVVLVIMLVIYFLISKRSGGGIDFLKGLFRI